MSDESEAPLESAWGRSASGRSGLFARMVALALLLLLGAVAFFVFAKRPNPSRAVVELCMGIRTSDESGFAVMSERYRESHDVSDFRRAIATLSELRDVHEFSGGPAPGFRWPDDAEWCGSFGEDLPGRVRVRTVWQGGPFGAWKVDRLSIDERQLDEDAPADVVCGVTR